MANNKQMKKVVARASKPIRKNQILFIFTSLLVTSVMGSLTGTYAWFEYSARAGYNYHGAAIGHVNALQLGVYSETILEDASKHGLIQDENDEHIYWCESKDSFDDDAVKYYCKSNGYSFKSLMPTSSGSFDGTSEFSLKPEPNKLVNYSPNAVAGKGNYLKLPMLFKTNTNAGTMIGEQYVYLKEANADGTGLIKNGLRVHFNSNIANFILNPTSIDDGKDVVGGALDLDMDGFYDHQNGKEYLYGEVNEGKLVYSETKSENKDPMNEEKRSTFNSAHAYDVYAIDNELSEFKTASYHGYNDNTLMMALAKADEETGIARLDVTIYIEGWSKYITNTEINNYFNLDMEFELQGE